MARRARLVLVVAGLALVILACGDDETTTGDGARPEVTVVDSPRVVRTGGMTTAFDTTERAFGLTARNINHYERQVFADGKDVFEADWVAEAGAGGDDAFVGLGPGFDAPACASCHHADGRAAGPVGDGALPIGLTVGLGTDDPRTVDHYGASLSSASVDGPGEAVVSVAYDEVTGTFADGAVYSLRRPTYSVEVADGPGLPDDAVLRVRVAPQLPGLGLLELVADDDILARADPDDADGDGVSGRPGTAVDLLTGAATTGRLGWNGNQPSVEQQTATALFRDMGLTSRYFPTESCDRWAPCPRQGIPVTEQYDPDYGDPTAGVEYPDESEVSDQRLYELTVYTQGLAVPAPRDVGDPEVERGWELFATTGCATCHAGPYTTSVGPMEGLSHQLIQPYTDLLVHDMGDGLADRTVVGEVVTTEWRTPPLWGIGLLETVSGHTDLLHDGRARGVEEAILWHDGEAAPSAAAYRALPAADRAALVRFVESL